MLLIDFDPDTGQEEQSQLPDLSAADPTLVRWLYLWMPVRLQADGTELLGGMSAGFSDARSRVPVLDMATWFHKRLLQAGQRGNAVYDCLHSWPCLSFNVTDGRTAIYSHIWKTAVEVDYEELLSGWERFGERIRDYVRRQIPGLRRHPFWSRWLEGVPYSAVELSYMLPPTPGQTTRIDFEPLPASMQRVREYGRYLIETMDPWSFSWLYLEMQVRVIVNGIDILAWRTNGEERLSDNIPILHFCAMGRQKLLDARTNGRSVYEFPDSGRFIRFELNDGMVTVFSPAPNSGGSISYADYITVLDAWEKFNNKVRNYLRKELPELLGHPYWGPWLDGMQTEDIAW